MSPRAFDPGQITASHNPLNRPSAESLPFYVTDLSFMEKMLLDLFNKKIDFFINGIFTMINEAEVPLEWAKPLIDKIPSTKQMANYMTGKINGTLDDIEGWIHNASNVLGEVSEIINAITQAILNDQASIDAFIKFLKETNEDAQKALLDILGVIDVVFGGVDKTGQDLGHFIMGVAGEADKFIRFLGSLAESLGLDVSDVPVVGTVVGDAIWVIDTVFPVIENVFETIESLAQDVLDLVFSPETQKAIVNELGNVIEGAEAGLVEGVSDLTHIVAGFISITMNSQAAHDIVNALEFVFNTTIDAIKNLIETIVKVVAQLAAVVASPTTWGFVINGIVNEIYDAVQLAQTAVDDVVLLLEAFAIVVASSNLVSDIINLLPNATQEIANDINTVEAIINEILDDIKSLSIDPDATAEQIKNLVITELGKVKTVILRVDDDVKRLVNELVDAARASKAASDLSSLLQTILADVESGIKSVLDEWDTVTQKIVKIATDPQTTAMIIKDLMAGLSKVVGVLSRAVNDVTNLVSLLVGGLTDSQAASDIHSVVSGLVGTVLTDVPKILATIEAVIKKVKDVATDPQILKDIISAVDTIAKAASTVAHQAETAAEEAVTIANQALQLGEKALEDTGAVIKGLVGDIEDSSLVEGAITEWHALTDSTINDVETLLSTIGGTIIDSQAVADALKAAVEAARIADMIAKTAASVIGTLVSDVTGFLGDHNVFHDVEQVIRDAEQQAGFIVNDISSLIKGVEGIVSSSAAADDVRDGTKLAVVLLGVAVQKLERITSSLVQSIARFVTNPTMWATIIHDTVDEVNTIATGIKTAVTDVKNLVTALAEIAVNSDALKDTINLVKTVVPVVVNAVDHAGATIELIPGELHHAALDPSGTVDSMKNTAVTAVNTVVDTITTAVNDVKNLVDQITNTVYTSDAVRDAAIAVSIIVSDFTSVLENIVITGGQVVINIGSVVIKDVTNKNNAAAVIGGVVDVLTPIIAVTKKTVNDVATMLQAVVSAVADSPAAAQVVSALGGEVTDIYEVINDLVTSLLDAVNDLADELQKPSLAATIITDAGKLASAAEQLAQSAAQDAATAIGDVINLIKGITGDVADSQLAAKIIHEAITLGKTTATIANQALQLGEKALEDTGAVIKGLVGDIEDSSLVEGAITEWHALTDEGVRNINTLVNEIVGDIEDSKLAADLINDAIAAAHDAQTVVHAVNTTVGDLIATITGFLTDTGVIQSVQIAVSTSTLQIKTLVNDVATLLNQIVNVAAASQAAKDIKLGVTKALNEVYYDSRQVIQTLDAVIRQIEATVSNPKTWFTVLHSAGEALSTVLSALTRDAHNAIALVKALAGVVQDSQGTKDLVVAIGSILVDANTALHNIQGTINSLPGDIQGLVSDPAKTVDDIKTLVGDTLNTVDSTVKTVVGDITALASQLASTATSSDAAKDAYNGASTIISSISTVVSTLTPIIEDDIKDFTHLVVTAAEDKQTYVDAINTIILVLTRTIDPVVQFASDTESLILTITAGVIESPVAQDVLNLVQTLVLRDFAVVDVAAGAIEHAIVDAANYITSGGAVGDIINGIKDLATTAENIASTAVNTAEQALEDIVNLLKGITGTVADSALAAQIIHDASTAAKEAETLANQAITAAGQALGDIESLIKEVLTDPKATIDDLGKLLSSVANTTANTASELQQLINGLASTADAGIAGVVKALQSTAKAAGDALSGVGKVAKSILGLAVQTTGENPSPTTNTRTSMLRLDVQATPPADPASDLGDLDQQMTVLSNFLKHTNKLAVKSNNALTGNQAAEPTMTAPRWLFPASTNRISLTKYTSSFTWTNPDPTGRTRIGIMLINAGEPGAPQPSSSMGLVGPGRGGGGYYYEMFTSQMDAQVPCQIGSAWRPNRSSWNLSTIFGVDKPYGLGGKNTGVGSVQVNGMVYGWGLAATTGGYIGFHAEGNGWSAGGSAGGGDGVSEDGEHVMGGTGGGGAKVGAVSGTAATGGDGGFPGGGGGEGIINGGYGADGAMWIWVYQREEA